MRIPAELAYERNDLELEYGVMASEADQERNSAPLALGVTLVTNNPCDFMAYPGLKIENWVA